VYDPLEAENITAGNVYDVCSVIIDTAESTDSVNITASLGV